MPKGDPHLLYNYYLSRSGGSLRACLPIAVLGAGAVLPAALRVANADETLVFLTLFGGKLDDSFVSTDVQLAVLKPSQLTEAQTASLRTGRLGRQY